MFSSHSTEKWGPLGSQRRERAHPASERRYVTVPSAPLGALLRRAGLEKVDLFFLDVEGAELQVLRTMDWTLPVRVWCIENGDNGGAIASLMEEHGYRVPKEKLKLGKQNTLWVPA